MHEEQVRKIQEPNKKLLDDLQEIEDDARERLVQLSEQLLKQDLSLSTQSITDPTREAERKRRLLSERFKRMAEAVIAEFQRALSDYL